jgi:hypothetical protein
MSPKLGGDQDSRLFHCLLSVQPALIKIHRLGAYGTEVYFSQSWGLVPADSVPGLLIPDLLMVFRQPFYSYAHMVKRDHVFSVSYKDTNLIPNHLLKAAPQIPWHGVGYSLWIWEEQRSVHSTSFPE